MIVDINGKPVIIGSIVRVLSVNLDRSIGLPSDEIERIKSIVGQELCVYSATDQYVSVKKVWEDGGVLSKGLSLSLKSHEIELVEHKC